MHPDTNKYNDAQASSDREICNLLAREIDRYLPEAENKIWHAHPVWLLEGNPIVGYQKLKHCVRLRDILRERKPRTRLTPLNSLPRLRASFRAMLEAGGFFQTWTGLVSDSRFFLVLA